MKHAFTGNASGKTKLIICGSDLLEKLEQVEYQKIIYVGKKKQAYGIEFNEIIPSSAPSWPFTTSRSTT